MKPRNSDEAVEWPDEEDEQSVNELLKRLELTERLLEPLEDEPDDFSS